MNSDTHSLIIPGLAFIDGIPDKCQHEWNGPAYYVTKSGKFIEYSTFKEWIPYTDQYRQRVVNEYFHRLGDPIQECGATCSKCGKNFRPDFF